MTPFLGEIIAWPSNKIPEGWLACDGSLLQIADNPALFSLIGTYYGGDGRKTFALPDLRGRTTVGALDTFSDIRTQNIGAKGGRSQVTLTKDNLPPHDHNFRIGVNTRNGTNSSPVGSILDADAGPFSEEASPDSFLGGVEVGNAGTANNKPIDITQPQIAINYIIALHGIYPARH